jgi:hypothetical protein
MTLPADVYNKARVALKKHQEFRETARLKRQYDKKYTDDQEELTNAIRALKTAEGYDKIKGSGETYLDLGGTVIAICALQGTLRVLDIKS